METFDYLLEKVAGAEIRSDPFPHIYIEHFLRDHHLRAMLRETQLPPARDSRELIRFLERAYCPVAFPGCSESADDYLAHGPMPTHTQGLTSRFGMAWRMERENDLIAALKSPEFERVVTAKFGIRRPVSVETGVQKYLDGYEISPHPDIRKKALTYMVNINPEEVAARDDLHTHLMVFHPGREHVREFWRVRDDVERCWVPWDWCETRFVHQTNNSLLLFAPGHDTLHAVRLRYDHRAGQRTQVYGNLWFSPACQPTPCTWRDLP